MKIYIFGKPKPLLYAVRGMHCTRALFDCYFAIYLIEMSDLWRTIAKISHACCFDVGFRWCGYIAEAAVMLCAASNAGTKCSVEIAYFRAIFENLSLSKCKWTCDDRGRFECCVACGVYPPHIVYSREANIISRFDRMPNLEFDRGNVVAMAFGLFGYVFCSCLPQHIILMR